MRGTATVNGTSGFTFESATADSGKPLDRTDSLRLVVTDETSKVVYDNDRNGMQPTVTGVVRISN